MEINTNQFELDELEGRRKAAKLFGTGYTYTFTEDKYAYYDCKVNGMAKDSIIEIKNRDCKSTTYQTDIIEYIKLRHLTIEAKNDNIFYLNFFSDGVARLYDLREIDITQVYVAQIPMNRTTATQSDIVNKLVIELPQDKAIRTYKNIF